MKEHLRLGLVVLVVIALAFGYVKMQEDKGYGLKAGTPAPELRLPARDGKAVDLGSFRGRLVVLNFWATWCPPCVAEMPSLERMHKALSAEGLSVVAVSVDEDEAALTAFVQRAGITFPVLRDPGGAVATASFKTTGYPETFVIDARGVILETYVGPAEWDTPEALAHFRRLLKPADR
jgi:peroxiredoxin